MKTKEFNLSKERRFDNITSNIHNQVYREDDVKEFIKRLKAMINDIDINEGVILTPNDMYLLIDKLAGEELSEEIEG